MKELPVPETYEEGLEFWPYRASLKFVLDLNPNSFSAKETSIIFSSRTFFKQKFKKSLYPSNRKQKRILT